MQCVLFIGTELHLLFDISNGHWLVNWTLL